MKYTDKPIITDTAQIIEAVRQSQFKCIRDTERATDKPMHVSPKGPFVDRDAVLSLVKSGGLVVSRSAMFADFYTEPDVTRS